MPLKTYSPRERQEKIELALSLRYEERKNWEEIASQLDLARSTLSEWRKDEDFKEADTRWRRSLRDKARGDSSQMLDEAVATIYELMKTDRSGYVRYMAACKLLDMNQVGNELEESLVDGQKELADFLLKKAKRDDALARASAVVRPGGLLPESIQAENEAYRDQKQEELQALEAEYREVKESA